MEDPIEKLHKLDRLPMQSIATFEIMNSERNANRNKKPPLGTLLYVNSWSK
jgi:hypothetical protein